jgi:gliding motility-associated-like protein
MVKTTPLPIDTICCSTTIDRGYSVTLNAVPASPGNTYSWTPSYALSCTNCPSTVASPTVTTTYYVTITDTSGCSKIDSVVIVVRVCGSLYLPNVFSPNGDGYNDVLYVYGNCIQTMELMIFDRWGNKVFESTDPKTGWDGTYKGSPMNADSYVYTLKIIDFDNNTTFKKGTITLMR